tara:strand:- start:127 stop:381 length:255 start_codon:yes stop_codon:yes gene_type:complete
MRSAVFTCGPFAEVQGRIEDFGTALYFSQLYFETIMDLNVLLEKLELARETEDKEEVKALEEQICFIEKVCSLENFDEQPFSEN